MEKYLKLIKSFEEPAHVQKGTPEQTMVMVSDNQRILDIYNKILTEEEEYRRILNEKDNVKGINAFD